MSNTSWNIRPLLPTNILPRGRRVLFRHGDGIHYFGVIRDFDMTLVRYEVVMTINDTDYLHLAAPSHIIATL